MFSILGIIAIPVAALAFVFYDDAKMMNRRRQLKVSGWILFLAVLVEVACLIVQIATDG